MIHYIGTHTAQLSCDLCGQYLLDTRDQPQIAYGTRSTEYCLRRIRCDYVLRRRAANRGWIYRHVGHGRCPEDQCPTCKVAT